MRRHLMISRCLIVCAALLGGMAAVTDGEELNLKLRYQQETSLNSGRFHQLQREEKWKAGETAIIVCDVWDLHHCRNAVLREEEMLPRLNELVNTARRQGVTIIHAPSDCMPFYENHPARKRAMTATDHSHIPHDCGAWCYVIPGEERAVYPIDQSDGGEDDDPAEHAEWAKHLESLGRNPGRPWKKQADGIMIDADRDYISDKGDEIWNVLQQHGIRNVILTGVHTNMCVLGRPFGLRQMVRNGMNTVLMRDLTDTMYNPARWPYVSHFTGTDLIVSHIEKYVCPTITSDQILGGQPLRFSKDARPHLVMLIAEDEYRTEETLPPFAVDELGRDFRVTMVFGSDQERHRLPGIQAVRDADILLVSMRRRVLPPADLQWVRDFVAAGKPVVGIRTASHAFSLRNQQPPEGLADWPEFDADVFGGNYHGHHANGLSSQVSLLPDTGVPDLNAIPQKVFAQGGSLYQTSPLKEGTTVLATGEIEGQPVEPVAWTFLRKDGGRSFYTSLGHVGDFAHPSFRQLLYQGICWAANIPPSSKPDTAGQHWLTTTVPESQIPAESAASPSTPTWYRCAVRLPQDWLQEGSKVRLFVESNAPLDVWVNGARCSPEAVSSNGGVLFELPSNALQAGEANLIVCRAEQSSAKDFFRKAPLLQVVDTKDVTVHRMLLEGRWQYRHGGDESLAGMPLPAKFGASADVVFRSPEPLWTVRPASVAGLFTAGIEGPACDAAGNVYAVNFLKQGTIGRVSPQGSSEILVTLPEGSTGNGIRFDSQGSFLVADYTGHNVLRVDPATGKISVLAHNDQMSQPNDLAISPDGTIFASDPDWKNGSGRIWRIDADGSTHCLIDDMGTTNGIEVSPDGQQLYVNESVQRNVWAFDITADKELQNKRLIREFPDFGFDGMRCDVDGNLYITRHGKGTVIKMTPAGDILREIPLPGTKPSNLCFGGPDGCTVYVTEVDGRQLLSFRVDRPGRSFGRQ